jgi:hypothetical protein
MAGQANDKIFTLLNKQESICLQIMLFCRSCLCLQNLKVPIRQGKNDKSNPKSQCHKTRREQSFDAGFEN